jgi:hypothetical protein
MAAPGKKFSFMRLVNNAFPNMARDDPNNVNLTPIQADNLLRYQLNIPHSRYLGENALYTSGITGSEALSKKVHKALIKSKIILPAPENGASEEQERQMTVNTAGITKSFASQMAVISVHAQRKLVGLLFFWEEELTRWKLLDAEERDILVAMEGDLARQNRDLVIALEAVEMKRRMLPSQRGEGTANVGKGAGHELPSYS